MKKFEGASENDSFERKKARYFSDFALAHFSKMKILAKGGILGKENSDWRNISEHCLVEGVEADVLAEQLGANREALIAAALLHDWYKRREVETMREEGVAAAMNAPQKKIRAF